MGLIVGISVAGSLLAIMFTLGYFVVKNQRQRQFDSEQQAQRVVTAFPGEPAFAVPALQNNPGYYPSRIGGYFPDQSAAFPPESTAAAAQPRRV